MRALGQHYEALAQTFLEQEGLIIITANYTAHHLGELDLIAYHDERLPSGKLCPTLVFVEVKMRHQQKHFGQAVESITPAKQQKLIGTAEHFLVYGDALLAKLGLSQAQKNALACRFDVITFDVLPNPRNIDKSHEKQTKIHWLKNAFLIE